VEDMKSLTLNASSTGTLPGELIDYIITKGIERGNWWSQDKVLESAFSPQSYLYVNYSAYILKAFSSAKDVKEEQLWGCEKYQEK
jgi:hypothetical protein